jgi:hypothetical protein
MPAVFFMIPAEAFHSIFVASQSLHRSVLMAARNVSKYLRIFNYPESELEKM